MLLQLLRRCELGVAIETVSVSGAADGAGVWRRPPADPGGDDAGSDLDAEGAGNPMRVMQAGQAVPGWGRAGGYWCLPPGPATRTAAPGTLPGLGGKPQTGRRPWRTLWTHQTAHSNTGTRGKHVRKPEEQANTQSLLFLFHGLGYLFIRGLRFIAYNKNPDNNTLPPSLTQLCFALS